MTKTEARLALCLRQRRFEWQLARDEQTRAAATLVAGKTHDLLNLIQIVQLATLELGSRCDETGKEFLEDLTRAADDAQRSLESLMAVARPEVVSERGAPVGAVVAEVIGALRGIVEVDIHLATSPDAATRASEEELVHLLVGLALDAAVDDAAASPVALLVREREINRKPWIEIVRSTSYVPDGERFELRAVEAIVARAGGELASSERRGGGEELIVALPVM